MFIGSLSRVHKKVTVQQQPLNAEKGVKQLYNPMTWDINVKLSETSHHSISTDASQAEAQGNGSLGHVVG